MESEAESIKLIGRCTFVASLPLHVHVWCELIRVKTMFAVTQSTLIGGSIHYGVRVSRSLSIISVLFQPKKKNTGFAAMTDDPYLVKLRKYKRGEGELTGTTRIPLMSEDRRLKEMENTPTLVVNSLGELS